MITHKIKLYGYTAELVGESQLVLGTVDSYGIEQIEIEIGGIWSGLVLFATFHYSGTATKMAVDSNGVVEVPPQATQSGNSASTRGKIVFHAVSETQQAISTDIEYRVYQHSDVDGNEPLPPDTSWNQIIAQAGAARDEAVQAASEAKKSLEEIGDSVERAEAAANRAEQVAGDVTSAGSAEIEKIKQAGTDEVNRVKSEGDVQVKRISEEGNAASGYAEQAKKYAEEAARYVSDVSDAANQAVSDINASKQTAITQISSAGSEQISNVQSAGNAVIETIESEKNVAVQAVKDAQTTGVNAVQAAQTAGVKAVNDAGDAKIEQIEQITDAYTKSESDARYAPIEAAIRPAVSGNPAMLEHSVAWAMQGLSVYGKSTQDGTPSPVNPVPIVSAGDAGSITVTVSDGADQTRQLVISTPNGLPGIPVDSGGNYTDAGGQQWVCDAIDYETQKYIQNCEKVVLDGSDDENWKRMTTTVASESRYYLNLAIPPAGTETPSLIAVAMCDKFLIVSAEATYVARQGVSIDNHGQLIVFCDAVNTPDVTNWKKWLKENPVTLIYQIATPIETPLSSEELAAYAALRTCDGTTVVATDAPVAGLSARYVADGAAYIESKIQAALSPVNQAI